MIEAISISTQAHKKNGTTHYRFRSAGEIYQAVNEAACSRRGLQTFCWGHRGIPVLQPSLKDVADWMLFVQYLYNKTKGIRVREDILSISREELNPYKEFREIQRIAWEFSGYYFYKGFQNAFGIYDLQDNKGRKFEIVYAINSVSFQDGSKYIRNSYGYAYEINHVARTIVAQVTGKQNMEQGVFDFRQLEYYF